MHVAAGRTDWPVPLVHLPTAEPFDAIFDMETNDPDDYLTLYASVTNFFNKLG